MNNIQETIFRTIETITDSKLKDLKFDKTIESIIVSDDKSDIGEYEVKYQDLLFTAYANNNTIKYSKDDNVLVLVPDGDMSNKKTIMSSSKREGEEYVDFNEVIDRLGVNFVDEDKDFSVNLSTTKDEVVGFKLKKQSMIDQYPGQTYLLIGADIYSDISELDRDGLYGISIDCRFLLDDGSSEISTFDFNIFNVTGNPYQSRGFKETRFPLKQQRLIEVVGARVYSKGFSKGSSLKFSKLTVEYVGVRDQDKSEYSGNIITPKGSHFRSGSLYPDEKLQLTMQFKQQGEILETEAISYTWFIMNSEVISDFHPDIGPGWEMLKNGVYSKDLIDGIGTNTLLVAADFVPSFSTFKCLASYKEKQVSVTDMTTLVDHTESITANIDSSNGVSFVNGIGKTVLTCRVMKNGVLLDEELDYEWGKVDENGNVISISKGIKNSIEVNANTIGLKTNYICEVSLLKDLTRPIATAYQTLVNVVDGSTQGISIVGGFRTVLYDKDGNAPNSLNQEGFQFDAYENGEKLINGQNGVTLNWTWKIPPANKTMLTLSNATMDIDNNQTVSNVEVLRLGVLPKFNFENNQNSVFLDVQYTKNGITNILSNSIPISITKVGSTGAEGAAGKPGANGKTYVYEIEGNVATINYDGLGGNPSPNSLGKFSLMFSENGNNDMARYVNRVVWNIQPNNKSILKFKNQSESVRVITTSRPVGSIPSVNPHVIELEASSVYTSSKSNNFISAEIYYSEVLSSSNGNLEFGPEMKFREVYPIAVSKNGEQGEAGDSPYILELISTNGLVFKDSDINTVIIAQLKRGVDIIPPENYRDKIVWVKIDDGGNRTSTEDGSFSPIFLDGKKEQISITEQDVLQRATFECSILE